MLLQLERFETCLALQIGDVAEACSSYLLNNCSLTAEQLAQLCVNMELFTTPEARSKVLQQLYALPWTSDTASTVSAVFSALASRHTDILVDTLQHKECGAFSLLQVKLWTALLSWHDTACYGTSMLECAHCIVC